MKRFHLVQQYKEYTDYDTVLGNTDPDPHLDSPATVAAMERETVRRLTLVDGERPYAYLTMRDYSEKDITIEAAQELLQEEVTA